eukprot:m.158164 g.158164  ORF g.158164 m.158164 type:complete len:2476 (+) comp15168_c4_seq50:222-7649(+)
MKIKRVPPKRLTEVSEFTARTIQAIKNASSEDLLAVLSSIQEIPKTKDDFYHWLDVMDKFDEVLAVANPISAPSEGAAASETEPLRCFNVQGAQAELVFEVLRVTTLAIESCASKNYPLYNSIEHLMAILTSDNLSLVTGALDLLCALGRHRNQENPVNDKQLQSMLLALAKPWPTSQDLLTLITDQSASLQLTPQAFLQSTLNRSGAHSETSLPKEIVLPELSPSTPPSALLAEFCRINNLVLPTLAQFELLCVFKLLAHFDNMESRCTCLRIRLLAICVCVLVDPDLGPKLFDAGPSLLKEMLVIAATEEPAPVALRISSLRVFYAYAHGNVKINTMLHLFEVGQPQGWLLSLLRKCARLLLEPTLPPSYPLPYITAVFALVQLLVPMPHVTDLMLESGVLRILIPILKNCKHIRLVTRTTRVVSELLRAATNLTIFGDNGILDHVARRLHAELEQCEPLCRGSRLGMLRAHKTQIARSLVEDMVSAAVGQPPHAAAATATTATTILAETPASTSAPTPASAGAGAIAMAVDEPAPSAGTVTAAAAAAEAATSTNISATTASTTPEPLCAPEVKSFLKLAFRVLLEATADSGLATAVRSLVEGPFVASMEMILRNPIYYGGTLWTESVRWIHSFCNNEPAQLSQLQDAGLMDAFFESLRKVNYTLDVLCEVIRAVSAFCLNARGLAAAIRAKPLDIVTCSLLDRRFTAMVGPDAAQRIGVLTEELLRHQPGLLEHGVDMVIRLMQRLLEIGNTQGLVVLTGFDSEIRRRERKWRAEEAARAAAAAAATAASGEPAAAAAAAVGAAEPTANALPIVNAPAPAAPAPTVVAQPPAAPGPDAAVAMAMALAAVPAEGEAGDAPAADAPVEMMVDMAAAEGGSPSGSGRASPTSTAATAGSQEVPLYDYINSTAQFLQSIFSERSATIINAFIERDGLKLLVQILQMSALPQVFSLSTALSSVCATFHALAVIHTDTYMYLCRELSATIATDEVQTHLKAENNFKVHAAVPKCLLYLDRLTTVGLGLPAPETEPANLDWTDIARIAESLPRLDVGVLVQLGAVSPEAKPTLASETATEIYRTMSSRFVQLLGRIVTPPDAREPGEDAAADLEAVAEATRQIVTAYIDSFNAIVSGPLTSTREATQYMGVLSYAVRQIKQLATTTSQRAKFNLDLFNCLASLGGIKVVAVSFRAFLKWLPALFETSKPMPLDDEPLVIPAHKHPLEFHDKAGTSNCAACATKQPSRLSRRCQTCDYTLCTACCERALLGPDTATFCSMVAGLLRDLSLLINPVLADLDFSDKLPAEALKSLKDMRLQLLDLLVPLWSHELLPSFPSFLLEALLIGLRDIVAALDLEHLAATKKPAPAGPAEVTADEAMLNTLMQMGFEDRLLATRALVRTNNNLHEAASMLLTGHSALISDLGQSLADSMLGAIAASIATPAPAAAAAEDDLTEEELLAQAIALSMQTDSATAMQTDAPAPAAAAASDAAAAAAAEAPAKAREPFEEIYEDMYERVTQCAMVCHNPKIVFATSSLLRVECNRDNGKGEELLSRLISEITSLADNLARAPLPDLLRSADNRRLHTLVHLVASLASDMVTGFFDIASAQGLFPSVVRLLSHTQELLLPTSDESSAPKIPAWLGPCFVLLDCAERAALFSVLTNSPVKEVPMRWEVQAFTRPQYYDFIDHGWQPLSPLSMAMLEREYVSGSRTALVRIDGHQCLVDFSTMVAVTDVLRESVSVRRIPERPGRAPVRLPALPPRVLTFSGLDKADKATLVTVCARLTGLPLDSLTLHSLSLLCVRLTRTEDMARTFLEHGGITGLLTSKQEDSFSFSLSLLVRHVIEDDQTLLSLFEQELSTTPQPRIPGSGESMRSYLERNSHLASRNPELFIRVAAKRLRSVDTGRPGTDSQQCTAVEISPADHLALTSPAPSGGMSQIAALLAAQFQKGTEATVLPVSRILNLLLELCGAYSAFPAVLLAVQMPSSGPSSFLHLLLEFVAQGTEPGRSEEAHTCSTLASRLISSISRWNDKNIQTSIAEYLHAYLPTVAGMSGEQRNTAINTVCSLLHTMIGRNSSGVVSSIANLMISHGFGKSLVDLLQKCDLQSPSAPATIDAIMKVLEPLARLAITHLGVESKDKATGHHAPASASATASTNPAAAADLTSPAAQVVVAPAASAAAASAPHADDEAAPEAAETFENNAVASDSQSDDDQVLEEIFADADEGDAEAEELLAAAAAEHEGEMDGDEHGSFSGEEHESHHSGNAGSGSASGDSEDEDEDDALAEAADLVEEINVVLGGGGGGGGEGGGDGPHDDDDDDDADADGCNKEVISSARALARSIRSVRDLSRGSLGRLSCAVRASRARSRLRLRAAAEVLELVVLVGLEMERARRVSPPFCEVSTARVSREGGEFWLEEVGLWVSTTTTPGECTCELCTLRMDPQRSGDSRAFSCDERRVSSPDELDPAVAPLASRASRRAPG